MIQGIHSSTDFEAAMREAIAYETVRRNYWNICARPPSVRAMLLAGVRFHG